jgi:hypothetical protein
VTNTFSVIYSGNGALDNKRKPKIVAYDEGMNSLSSSNHQTDKLNNR